MEASKKINSKDKKIIDNASSKRFPGLGRHYNVKTLKDPNLSSFL